MLTREHALTVITERITWLATLCDVRGAIHLLDGNTISHEFFCRLMNEIYDLKLVVLDRIQSNFPAIDLGDETNKRSFQITADKSSDKVQTTLDMYAKRNLAKTYGKMQIIVIGKKQGSYEVVKVPDGLSFVPDDDIIDTKGLIKSIDALSTEKLEAIAKIVQAEIKLADSHDDAPFRQLELIKQEANSTNLFYYGSRLVEFRGRETEMEFLDRFLKSPSPFAWCLITGSGGSGKSRLALELCMNIVDWHAGFVNKSMLTDLSFWQIWQPNRPTLLVVDYAEAYAENLGDVARCLQRKKHRPRYAIRLLIIERERKDWYDTYLGAGNSDREVTSAGQYPYRGAEPLHLKSLEDSELWAIVRSVAATGYTTNDKERFLARFREVSPDGSVLWAIFLAKTSFVTEDRVLVVREILRRERQVYWKPANATHHDESLVAFATLCGGAPFSQLRGHSGWLEESMRQFSLSRYQAIVRKLTKSQLAPLEPDIMGELFVLDWLNSASDAEADEVLRAAWSVSAIGVSAFMRRAIPDFPRHEALQTLIKPTDASPLARTAWASSVVHLLRDIPTQHLDLGATLFQHIERLSAQHPDEVDIYENYGRATLNLMVNCGRAKMFDRAQLHAQLESLLEQHPDKDRARRLRVRMLASDAAFYVAAVEAELDRPLPPAPFTFVRAHQIMNCAEAAFEECARHCVQCAFESDVLRCYSFAAFHVVLGYSALRFF